MICVEIDELTPCLKDLSTGDIVETEVIQVKRKSFLQKFAIAAKKSEEFGYKGEMTGFAANKELELHYIEKFGAIPIEMLHPYQIIVPEESAKKIQEVYDYEWTDDEL